MEADELPPQVAEAEQFYRQMSDESGTRGRLLAQKGLYPLLPALFNVIARQSVSRWRKGVEDAKQKAQSQKELAEFRANNPGKHYPDDWILIA
jgi:hypothetical protein